MAGKKSISRRAVLFGAGGGILGFMGIKPEDSSEEATEKVIAGTGIGVAVGAGTGLVDKVHKKLGTDASPEDIEEWREFGRRSYQQHLKEQAMKRSEEGKDQER